LISPSTIQLRSPPAQQIATMASSITNYSLFAVPAYWILCLIPHNYAIAIMKKANNGHWDNTSPRSSIWDAKLKASTPAEVFGRYERAEAAQKNGFENFPIFVGAILAGNIAKLGNPTLNSFRDLFGTANFVHCCIYQGHQEQVQFRENCYLGCEHADVFGSLC